MKRRRRFILRRNREGLVGQAKSKLQKYNSDLQEYYEAICRRKGFKYAQFLSAIRTTQLSPGVSLPSHLPAHP